MIIMRLTDEQIELLEAISEKLENAETTLYRIPYCFRKLDGNHFELTEETEVKTENISLESIINDIHNNK